MIVWREYDKKILSQNCCYVAHCSQKAYDTDYMCQFYPIPNEQRTLCFLGPGLLFSLMDVFGTGAHHMRPGQKIMQIPKKEVMPIGERYWKGYERRVH